MTDAAAATAPPAANPPRSEILYWAALFAIIGPPIGAVLPVGALIFSAVSSFDAAFPLGIAALLLVAIPACYLFGLVPGAIAGAAGSFLATRLSKRAAVIGATALVGAAASSLWSALISGFSELDAWILVWIAAAGAISAAICAYIATARDAPPAEPDGAA
ncbi:hypothetical protein [Phenylobacterium sp.]|jgi:hypothetical protein|uniref:hypothetical protein n=1 Tax=Phenylobacterium sp. TaxID=1871053 RepID=UPI002E3781DB|nr:hypothetical protein [Phenylobacterium sp.]HEX2559907.1 hypothetical protein [Phenylobacterium sp.]